MAVEEILSFSRRTRAFNSTLLMKIVGSALARDRLAKRLSALEAMP